MKSFEKNGDVLVAGWNAKGCRASFAVIQEDSSLEAAWCFVLCCSIFPIT